jgi:hypothetical protein
MKKTPEELDSMTLGELIDYKGENRGELADANKVVKALTSHREEIDAALLKKLDAADTTRGANKNASVSISEEVVPHVDDWDAVYNYIQDSGDFALLQRRMSAAAYRELLQTTTKVPGINPRTVRKVNMRSL